MGLQYKHLDDRTRALMLEEIDSDIAEAKIYLSNYLTVSGRAEFASLLKDAARLGTDDTLGSELQRGSRISATTARRTPSGGTTTAKVPHTAHITMSEGEFNRYYVRAICRRVIEDGRDEVRIYRGKSVSQPRPQSELLIGTVANATAVLADLRNSVGVETALGVPPGPNSGLTVEPSH